ncbi:MAG: hypothetical protein J5543_09125 [Bacteroidales bacterium]|nr:hypothetical protein [Bacteroidales bacterium]
MKRLFLLLFGLCMSSMVWAKDYLLVIDFTDGTDMTFALSTRPVLTFAEQNLIISAEGQKTEIEMVNVANFHFKEGLSDIRSPRMDEDLAIVWQEDDQIVITNVSPGTIVRLYGIDGTFYPNNINAFDNRQVVSLASLPKGIYLLNINSHRTLKINRK